MHLILLAALVALSVADPCGDCNGFCSCLDSAVVQPLSSDSEMISKVENVKNAFKTCAGQEMAAKWKDGMGCAREALGCNGEDVCKSVFEFICDEEAVDSRRRRRGAGKKGKKGKKGKGEWSEEHVKFFQCVMKTSGLSQEELMALHEAMQPYHAEAEQCLVQQCYGGDMAAIGRFANKAEQCFKDAFGKE